MSSAQHRCFRTGELKEQRKRYQRSSLASRGVARLVIEAVYAHRLKFGGGIRLLCRLACPQELEEAVKIFDSSDRYEVAGKRDDGVTFHFMGSRRLSSSKYPEWCSVRFERGEIKLDMLMGVAYIIDHEHGTTTIVPNLAIDYDGRLEKVMKNFADSIGRSHKGYSDTIKLQAGDYLSRMEMLMNTEAGITLQYDGMKRIGVRL